MRIKVVGIHEVRSGSLLGLADVMLDDVIVIRDWKILAKHRGGLLVRPPERKVWERGGKRYIPLVEVRDGFEDVISQAILEAWRKFLGKEEDDATGQLGRH